MSDVTAERWLPVPGYEGLYEISDLGRVRSLPRRSCRGQVLKPSLSPLGYPRVHLNDRGRDRLRFIHLLVAESFIGPKPEGKQVRHLDGDSQNNRLSNLAYGTPSENVFDQVRHGTHTWASRTRCKWGHEFTPENTRVYREKHGGLGRDCRQCRRDRDRARRARRKAMSLTDQPIDGDRFMGDEAQLLAFCRMPDHR